MDIIAHRGASADAPENTLPALELAWTQGADGIEVDLWLTRDAHVVASHDADTARCCGEKRVVNETDFADLRRLNAGHCRGVSWNAVRIPELAEVLALVPRRKRVYLEIKDSTAAFTPRLAAAVTASGLLPRQVTLISFDAAALQRAATACPGSPALLLAGLDTNKATPLREQAEALILRAGAAGFRGLDLEYSGLLCEPAVVADVHAAGLYLATWTVDDAAAARRLMDLGVDAVTSNIPGRLRQALPLAAVSA